MPDWPLIVRSRVGAAIDAGVVDEIAQHAEDLYRARLVSGQSAAEAQGAVEAEMADLQALVRAARRARMPILPEPLPPGRRHPLSVFLSDLRHALRATAARPGFATVAVLTLALGIGANTAIFSVIDSVLLNPLPFRDPHRLIMLWEQDAAEPETLFILSAPNYLDITAQSTSFERAAIWEYQNFNVLGGPEPEQVPGLRVSSSVFPMLGVAPQLGRTFTAPEDEPGHQVVVIGDALWRRGFGSRPDIIGQNIQLNGRPFEVIGVMPPAFRFTRAETAVWVPIQFNERDRSRDAHSFYAAARLKPGVAFEAARIEAETIGARLAQAHEANRGESASITPMDELGVRHLRPTLAMLQAAVLLVLLIACVNVANLMLAQSSARQREFAIRSALGAGRARLASQLLAEGVVLAVAGGGAGILLAWVGTMALSSALPAAIRLAPFRDTQGAPLDLSALAFTALVALVTAVVFTLAPIVDASRTVPATSLRSGGDRGATSSLTRVRAALVAAEVCLAVIVLAGAGLMIKSVSRLLAVSPGLDTSNLLVMDMALPQPDFYGPPERTTFCQDVAREVEPLPGVQSVGAISHLPLSGANAGRALTIEGRPRPDPSQGLEGTGAAYRLTCPGYFATLGIPIVRGRDFTHRDVTGGLQVAIINEAAAARYWPGEDPIGRRIKLGGASSTNPWMTIVGVAGSVRHFGLDTDAPLELYRPYTQAAWPVMTITTRTTSTPLASAASVRAALSRIDRELPVSRIRTMEQVLEQSLGSRRFPMLLLGIFSAVALALAVIGVYGVVSYLVSQRAREIGIRVALGARRRDVVGLIVRRAAIPIAIGLAAGVFGALASSRLLESLLYQVTPSDPVVLSTIVGILGGAALIATLMPARRAAGVDPLIVLKVD